MSRKPASHDSDLDLAQRLALAELDVEACDGPGPLTPAQCAELDRRLEEYDRDPDAGEPWEVVRAEILRDLERDRASAA